MAKPIHITLLTDARYLKPKPGDWYVENIFQEDDLLTAALATRGFNVHRTNWDNPDFDWTQTQYALFRTTWDYFDRFPEFSEWLQTTKSKTIFLNPLALVQWNMDKHYLNDLAMLGINVPPTIFLETGNERRLADILQESGWNEAVLKPAVGGAGRHTYRLNGHNCTAHEGIFRELITNEAMLLQEFMYNVPIKGEVALMVFDGKFTHAVLKRAKEGDFRVQDDFGGTVYDYTPTAKEIAFAESVVRACSPLPIYARVDLIWDNENQLSVSELEMIEPELWMRNFPESAEIFADALLKFHQKLQPK
jgi:glutathione synthase/RimK-type ligase-like ATP-grasp enzyme